MQHRILFVDDDKDLCETTFKYMSAKGYHIETAASGADALAILQNKIFDLIILDVLMPYMDGYETCREICRLCRTPVIFLSALNSEKNYLEGFSCGGVDYIEKPYRLSVLCEKANSIINKYRGSRGTSITIGALTLNTDSMVVNSDRLSVQLKGKEFGLLLYLFSNPGVVLSRKTIIDNVWGYAFEGSDRVVDTYIKLLRIAWANTEQ